MDDRLRDLRERARKQPPVGPFWARSAWHEQTRRDNEILLEIVGELVSDIRLRDSKIARLQGKLLKTEGASLALLRQNQRYDVHIKRLGSKISALEGSKKR